MITMNVALDKHARSHHGSEDNKVKANQKGGGACTFGFFR